MTTTPIKRRNRYQGHSPLNDLMRSDWVRSIELDPDRFDAFLYLPITGSEQPPESSPYEESEVIELDANQDNLSYGEPLSISVVDCPTETEHFFMMNAGDESLGESDEPLLLRVGAETVPIGSVLEWDEETAQGEATRVWWYVHDHVGVGTANIGRLSICIPMRNFDATNTPTAPDEGVPLEQKELSVAIDDTSASTGEIVEL